ncbi:ABC-2 type transport system permease protein [Nonomuraea maritima]|uniref:ABC-2 type transport system permease protein n=1 Tax=Nonomuraea maritima TaxID=683260 RepID=A0A1G9HKV8_9ACTN|nr:ABC transporter permease [Nonomuraea maritima]SDL13374.1 ABC-2 type transport system permease protein [Nonomuraea maritima]
MTAYTLAQFRLSHKLFWRTPAMVAMGFGFPLVVGGLFPLMMPDAAWGGASVRAYLVTGVLVLSLGMLAFMNLLEVLVQRRQQLILKRLRGTELPDLAIFAGEILCVTVVVLVQVTLLIALARVAHGIALPVNPALLIATVIAGTAVFAAMAVAVSGRIPAQGMTVFVGLPFLLLTIGLSGLAYPVSQMPDWAQVPLSYLPFTPIANGIRTAYLGQDFVHQQGSAVPADIGVLEGFQVMGQGWIVLAVWLIAALWAATRWFKWEPRRG